MTVQTNNNEKYRVQLVQQIKDAGQEIINRAETMVHPDLELILSGEFFHFCRKQNRC